MPFKSQAQRAYLHIHHPEIAERWEKETPKNEELPSHVGEKSVSEMAFEAVKRRITNP